MNETTEQGMEVLDTKTGEMTIERAPTPEELLLSARDAARALEAVIMSNERPPVMFNGKRHLEYPHWQTVGAFYHVSVATQDAEPVEIGGIAGFKAKATLIDSKTGLVVGGAESYCMRDEPNWKSKPIFQLASMAQTRAGSKALSNKFRYMAIVAGYEPTPSEEMPDEMKGAGRQVSMPRPKVPVAPTEHEMALEAQRPPEDDFGPLPTDPGQEGPIADVKRAPASKFYTQLHKIAREHKVPPEAMKKTIKALYGEDSSKDLTDSECASLIKLVQQGGIK